MKDKFITLKNEEKAVFALRSLYSANGYSQYKMSKFEEYDLYVRNKDFLISDSIITFTDTNGRLMALKPDVTLSIIKNSADNIGSVEKVYYNENVYRVSKGAQSFKEIMQVGLECIGNIDDYCLYEVLMLAAKSLKSISSDCVLDLSNLDIVSDAVDALGVPDACRQNILKCIGEKNLHEIAALCDRFGADEQAFARLKALLSMYGSANKVLPQLRILFGNNSPAVEQLSRVMEALDGAGLGDMVHIDFSVMHDMNYYNGIVFKGFLNGVPSGVLSGGQYDKLMKKMGRKSGAVGFAVYLDLLERMTRDDRSFDFDVLLLYDDGCDLSGLSVAVGQLGRDGKTVMVQRTIPKKLRFCEIYKFNGEGVERLENNA
ncbi:MAG: ATP phosphoribosyltransferase regulatory subunit [Clostridia bacterium]|nr:ATP phosphoribosyltransferase regulatory subunit [Clostridia bacterium]